MSRKIVAAVTSAAACALLLIGCSLFRTSVKPGTVDEPMQAGLKVDHFKPAEDPYFAAMDGGIHLSPQEEAGRNMWIVWSGGNDRFWDTLGKRSVGTLDLLKAVSTYNPAKDQNAPAAKRNPAELYSRNTLRNGYKYFRRGQRWKYFGMVNEPCFHEGDGGDPNRWGLWLDRRDPGCPADPFEDESRYPGVKVGSRGKDVLGKKNPVGSYYGYASGVVGLRLFPNPDFDEAAAKAWNPTRYYTDPGYYNDPNLVRPYRIGMSCGFCHVGPHPLHPPANPEEPKWENLSSNVGAQYAWIDRIFAWENNENSFAFQVFHTYRPGALDTSLVSTDNINNPRTMNAIYNLAERLDLARPAADRPGLYSKPLHPETLPAAQGTTNSSTTSCRRAIH